MGKRLTLADLKGVSPGVLAGSPELQNLLAGQLPPKADGKPSAQFTQIKGVSSKKKPQTEIEFAAILRKQVEQREIISFREQAITLVVGDPPTRYTPDFYVVAHIGKQFDTHVHVHIRMIEVKGPRIEEDAMAKFRAARMIYPEYEWQMWQRAKGGEWAQII